MHSDTKRAVRILGLFAAVYFVIYPEDVAALVAPLSALIVALAEPLRALTHSISPWLYATAIAGVLAWTATRLWGRSSAG